MYTQLLQEAAGVHEEQPTGGCGGGEGRRCAADPVAPAAHVDDQLLVGGDGPAPQSLQRGGGGGGGGGGSSPPLVGEGARVGQPRVPSVAQPPDLCLGILSRDHRSHDS